MNCDIYLESFMTFLYYTVNWVISVGIHRTVTTYHIQHVGLTVNPEMTYSIHDLLVGAFYAQENRSDK